MSEIDQDILTRMGEIRDLLSKFGATLHGYSPGVSLFVAGERCKLVSLESGEWAWLEPLLRELASRREGTWAFGPEAIRKAEAEIFEQDRADPTLRDAARALLRDYPPDRMCSSESRWAAWLELEKAAGVVPSVLAPQGDAVRAMLARIYRDGEEHGET